MSKPAYQRVLLKVSGEAFAGAGGNVDVDTTRPDTPYRETISGSVTQHARHKKQTGGHGQFGDVIVEIKPQKRGEGFAFTQRVTGGVVPREANACMPPPD